MVFVFVVQDGTAFGYVHGEWDSRRSGTCVTEKWSEKGFDGGGVIIGIMSCREPVCDLNAIRVYDVVVFVSQIVSAVVQHIKRIFLPSSLGSKYPTTSRVAISRRI